MPNQRDKAKRRWWNSFGGMFFGVLTGAVIGQMVPPGLDSVQAPLESLYYTVGFAVVGAIFGLLTDSWRTDG